MDLIATAHGALLVVTVCEDRIDAASAIQFKERMREVTQTPSERVLLDLSQVQFLDSSGLGAVVGVMKLLGADRRLELVWPDPDSRQGVSADPDGYGLYHPPHLARWSAQSQLIWQRLLAPKRMACIW